MATQNLTAAARADKHREQLVEGFGYWHAGERKKLERFYDAARQAALREAMDAIEQCLENGPSTDLLTCGQQLGIRSALIAVETLGGLAGEGG